MALKLESPAFTAGAPLPRRFTCDDENVSPALAWSQVPARTEALALVMDDPDAPAGTFTHWLVWDIPPSLPGLQEGCRAGDVGVSGRNDFGKTGYGGPCPPKGRGPHRYVWRLHALQRPLGLPPDAPRADVLAALEQVTIATATVVTPYER